MTRRSLGVRLLAGAVLLAVAGALLWAKGTHDAEERLSRDQAFAIFTGNPVPREAEPDRTLSVATFGIAGVLLLGGLITLALSLPATAAGAGPSDT